jgi:hypothetical protein
MRIFTVVWQIFNFISQILLIIVIAKLIKSNTKKK